MKGEGSEIRRQAIVRTTLEALYAVFHFLAPVIPVAAGIFFDRVGTGPMSIHRLRPDLYNLVPGTPVVVGDVLFKKIEEDSPSPITGGGGAPSAKSASSAPSSKAAKAVPVDVPAVLTINQLDLRVGLITSCKKHETADKLYCETINVGESEDRSIASGLVPHYTLDEMQNRLVVVVCNLKPRKMVGFSSNGMVLCAVKKLEDGSEKVEFVEVPAGAKPGDRIVGEGLPAAPALSPNQVEKNKVTEAVFPGFTADSEGVAKWSEHKLVVEGTDGFCYAKTVRDGILR
jgi:methionine--tRNA ligase beta chain